METTAGRVRQAVGRGAEFRRVKTFRLPFTASAVPAAPEDVAAGLESGTIEVRPTAGAPFLPLKSLEDLEELCFFLGLQSVPLAHPGLAAALQTLTLQGWHFKTSGEVGAYGAYNALTDPDLDLGAVQAVRDQCEVPCASAEEVEEWGRRCELPGLPGRIAAQAGLTASRTYRDEPAEAVARLRQEHLDAQAAALADACLPEEPMLQATAGLEPKSRAAVAQALLEHPRDRVAAAAQALEELQGTTWQQRQQAASLGRALLPVVAPDSPLVSIVESAWDGMANDESREALLSVVYRHLDAREPADLRKVGLEAMSAVKSIGYYVQAARLGSVFTTACPPPELEWVEGLMGKLSAEDSCSAVYRQLLASPVEKNVLFARALAQVDYGRDGLALARHALEQLDPADRGPAVTLSEQLLRGDSLSGSAVQAAVQAALENPRTRVPRELARVGLRAVRLSRSSRLSDCQAERTISRRYLELLPESPLARAALRITRETRFILVPSENVIQEAALTRPEADGIDAEFVEEVAGSISALDRQTAARAMLQEVLRSSSDPLLKTALEKLPLDSQDLDHRLAQELRVCADLRMWQSQLARDGPNGGVKTDQDFVWVNGIRVPVRKPVSPPGAGSPRPDP